MIFFLFSKKILNRYQEVAYWLRTARGMTNELAA